MPFFDTTVPPQYDKNERLDKYIASLPNGMNRSRLKNSIIEILINNKNAKLSQKIKPLDKISIQWEDNIPNDVIPQNIPLEIIYEDENVTVINKEQGMVTHPACGNWDKTLVNALLFHWGREAIHLIKEETEAQIQFKRRPGIVHRLDKETSGIIITAKNRDSEEWLQNQFKKRTLQKEYILICTGIPEKRHGDLRTQIIRDPKNRQRFKAVCDTEEGKFARTIYHVISIYGNYSLIRVRIKTGRTHQIRVHMKYLGCPILGDSLYNTKDSMFKNASLMLHSFRLKIKLPFQNEYTCFQTKVPQRFVDIEKQLKKMYTRK